MAFHDTGIFLYPLETAENQRFPNTSGGRERGQWP